MEVASTNYALMTQQGRSVLNSKVAMRQHS